MATCKTCQNPQVERINAILASGTPIRRAAQMFGIPRSSLTRHAKHVQPLNRPLGLIPQPPIDLTRVDVLAEARDLLDRARTERERLKALEQIRAATALVLRSMDEPDEESLLLLERNLTEAEEVYRQNTGSFEQAVRALQGVREAIRQRLDAVRVPDGVEISFVTRFNDSAPSAPGKPFRVPLSRYFAGIPKRYHDVDRYLVARTIFLSFAPDGGHEDVKVYDAKTGGLVWTK